MIYPNYNKRKTKKRRFFSFVTITHFVKNLFNNNWVKNLFIISCSVIITYNINTRLGKPDSNGLFDLFNNESNLYLMDVAKPYLENPDKFEERIRTVALNLNVPPEWLMVVIYRESMFKSHVENAKGSGATGLIQFMPSTASELGTSTYLLSQMPAHVQLDYVEKYFLNALKRPEFNNKAIPGIASLTEMYLTVLYPKAIGKDYCYMLYAHPSIEYKKNSGLDRNKDGSVTVSDIDQMLKQNFKEAYILDPIYLNTQ